MPTSQLGTSASMLGDFVLGFTGDLPPPPALNTVPLLQRVPDLENRLRLFTDRLSAIFNSLARTGQIVQTAIGEYRIVVSPDALLIAPGEEPDASPYYGQLWVDLNGDLHYMSTEGVDYQLTPLQTSMVSNPFTTICRVLANADLTIADTYCLVVADYFSIASGGVLTLAGDAALEIV